MITGIVLAAGVSRRMGEPKPLLEVEGRTFLARVCRALREGGCGEVVVVCGPDGAEGAAAVAAEARACGARVVVNPRAGAEQIDSLRVALRTLLAEVEAVIVTPADLPRLGPRVVSALIAAFRERGGPLVLPTHGGRHGHPALFARALLPELLEGELPEGARGVVHAHAAEAVEVAVDEPGILRDVDTPADYRRLLDEAE